MKTDPPPFIYILPSEYCIDVTYILYLLRTRLSAGQRCIYSVQLMLVHSSFDIEKEEETYVLDG
ncbi:hypothetical protein BX666DRAFT_2006817 [Dichotomocladium elegans]|nr:hypothetical protein BX666DRAFT_2006817 [Dichotomocladium elegans]